MLEKLHIDLTYTQHSPSKSWKLLNKRVSENGGLKVLQKIKLEKKYPNKPLTDELG